MSDGAAGPVAFASHRILSADGLSLHARVHGQDRGGGRDVVCLPGLTRNASEFQRLAPLLLAAGAADRVVAIDYRGRGLSDHDPDPAHYTIPVEAADLLAVLADLGIARAAFVGVSRGGLIGMVLGAARPDLVAALVLVDIGPVVEREGLLRIKGYVGRFALPANLEEGAAQLKTRFGDQFPNLEEEQWRDWAGTVWSQADRSLVLAHDPALARSLADVDETSPIPDLWDAFDALVDRPVMAIRGGLSDLLSASTLAEMERRHPGLVAATVPDEGHTPLLHRPELAAEIAEFVRGAFRPG